MYLIEQQPEFLDYAASLLLTIPCYNDRKFCGHVIVILFFRWLYQCTSLTRLFTSTSLRCTRGSVIVSRFFIVDILPLREWYFCGVGFLGVLAAVLVFVVTGCWACCLVVCERVTRLL